MSDYRNLIEAEIVLLQERGCRAEDWGRVRVKDGFRARACANVRFTGDNELGCIGTIRRRVGGVTIHAGVRDVALHNCRVGDNCCIRHVQRGIANLEIGDNVVIQNCGSLHVSPGATFGNGVEVATMIESGGREVPIYDRLSAQIAYMMAFYRYRPRLMDALRGMVQRHVSRTTSDRGFIGSGTRILDCGMLRDVRIGEHADIIGVTLLRNATVHSSEEARTRIGEGVNIHDAILQAGSLIDGGTQIERCFIGQGVRLVQQFCAENSLFFANCEGYMGEACSIFAGPFTVTHHKSTLLLTALYSFYNAGSGSNFSNHRYKLGPLHQGVLERGCKTGSSSYILWPARAGAFTAIIGRHYEPFDTTDLPFSYLVEENNHSLLLPAANLFSVGTVRDADKWSKRDRRQNSDKLDRVHFDALSPYTAQKCLRAIETLKTLKSRAGAGDTKEIDHAGVRIPAAMISKGILHYQAGLDLYIGDVLARWAEDQQNRHNEIDPEMLPDPLEGDWIDLCGQYLQKHEQRDLIGAIEAGEITSIDDVEADLDDRFERYRENELAWVVWLCRLQDGTPLDIVALSQRLRAWRDAIDLREERVLHDAQKEFAPAIMTGFGLDGDGAQSCDFAAVRGRFEDNAFVQSIRANATRERQRANALLRALTPHD